MTPLQGNLDFFLIRASQGPFRLKHKTQGPTHIYIPKGKLLLRFKGFSVVNEAEVGDFLEFSCFFYEPMDVGNLISGSSAFSKTDLNIWKFGSHTVEAWLGEF